MQRDQLIQKCGSIAKDLPVAKFPIVSQSLDPYSENVNVMVRTNQGGLEFPMSFEEYNNLPEMSFPVRSDYSETWGTKSK